MLELPSCGQSQFALGCVTDDSSSQQVLSWLDAFPDSATQGIGMGDLSIKKEWEELCRRHRMSRVLVWTLDADLVNLDRPAQRR